MHAVSRSRASLRSINGVIINYQAPFLTNEYAYSFLQTHVLEKAQIYKMKLLAVRIWPYYLFSISCPWILRVLLFVLSNQFIKSIIRSGLLKYRCLR